MHCGPEFRDGAVAARQRGLDRGRQVPDRTTLTGIEQVAVGGQRIVFGSAILMDDPGGPVRGYHWDGVTQTGGAGMHQPRYLIALASDLPLPLVGGGVFEQPINDSDIIQGWARALFDRDQQIANLTARLAERDGTSTS